MRAPFRPTLSSVPRSDDGAPSGPNASVKPGDDADADAVRVYDDGVSDPRFPTKDSSFLFSPFVQRSVIWRSQRSPEGPNGHLKVPTFTGRSQRSLEGPNSHWKVPTVI